MSQKMADMVGYNSVSANSSYSQKIGCTEYFVCILLDVFGYIVGG